jgi:flagellar protein FliS
MGNALAQYRSVDSSTAAGGASGHRLVQLLLQGALDRLAAARGHMERREHAAKGHSIGRALDILGHLRATLDLERGAEVAANLESLYLYMETRLVEASARNETGPLEEVAGLLREVKAAWDVIEGTVQ